MKSKQSKVYKGKAWKFTLNLRENNLHLNFLIGFQGHNRHIREKKMSIFICLGGIAPHQPTKETTRLTRSKAESQFSVLYLLATATKENSKLRDFFL